MVGVAARQDVFRLLGTVINDRFRVDEQIAEGGFAVVYRACQVALDRPVAVKVLKTPAGYDAVAQDEFRAKFAAEARTIARLKHPNIVDVYDFAVSAMPSGELAPWMALEWMDGETLETRIARRREQGQGGLAPAEALELLYPAVEALAFAHRQGIVHRDVKPANIMVSDSGHGRTVRVLDFGIAKIMQGEEPAGTGRTRTGSVPAFSPAYAAPEQVTFSRTGPWTDVHALGLMFTELVTGKPPFPDPEASVHEQVMAAVRPTPAGRGVNAGAFEAVIARAVALAPGDRWKNAGELLEALDRAAGDASPARPRRSRRRRAFLAAGALAALGGALLIGRAGHEKAAVPVAVPPPAVPSAQRDVPAAPPPQRAEPPAPIPAAVATDASPRKAARRTKKAVASPEAAPPAARPKRTDLFDDTK